MTVDIPLWTKAATLLDWIQPPRAVVDHHPNDNNTDPHPYTWFPGGVLNTCYNAVDRHCLTQPNCPALIWDSTMVQAQRIFTYAQLLDHVQTLAGVLQSHGVGKGDTVLLYMPMVPEAVFTLLACARLGAVHSAVFGKKKGGCINKGKN
jgi:propionyl-CoA synthetase